MLSWKKKLKHSKKESSKENLAQPELSPVASTASKSTETLATLAESVGQLSVQDPIPPSVSTTVKPGCLTVKMYLAKDLALPFDMVLNEFILNKIASCADDCDQSLLASNISKAVEKADSVLLPAADATGCLPALVAVPGADGSQGVRNPLLYVTVEFDKNVSLVQPQSGFVRDPSFNNVLLFDVNGSGLLVVQVFVKIPNVLIPKNLLCAVNPKTPSQDVLVGAFKLPLSLNYTDRHRILDHKWLDLSMPGGSKGGQLNVTIEFKPNKSGHSLTMDDFDLLKVIGKGSFGKVMQVRKKDTQRVYALKSIRKAHIVAKLEVTHTLAERNVLVEVNNPFIVSLKFCFQLPDKLYFVLDFINGGELFHHLQREKTFSLPRSKLYICELLLAIEHLHSLNVIYRDLKPENILLDYQGHIALCDFGLCKMDMKLTDRTDTFCGTPEYLAPELILGQGYTRSVDWWTLGILLYEMLTGLPPFYDENIPQMYKNILNKPLKFPEIFDVQAKDLLIKLLNRDPEKRLGANGSDEVKAHPFFLDIDWKKLVSKGYTPLFKPPVSGAFDTKNFDAEFTSEAPLDSVVNDHLTRSMQKQFEGWTYVGESKLPQE